MFLLHRLISSSAALLCDENIRIPNRYKSISAAAYVGWVSSKMLAHCSELELGSRRWNGHISSVGISHHTCAMWPFISKGLVESLQLLPRHLFHLQAALTSDCPNIELKSDT